MPGLKTAVCRSSLPRPGWVILSKIMRLCAAPIYGLQGVTGLGVFLSALANDPGGHPANDHVFSDILIDDCAAGRN